MGNRAVITTKENFENDGVGVYLHWNGGRDSVEPFLQYCKLKGYRSPEEDSYGWARLTAVIANFFGGTTSVGIDILSHLDCDNGDNGVYIIENWEIVDRKYFDGSEQYGYDLKEFMLAIDEHMPEADRIGKEYLTAPVIKPNEMKIGDVVAFMDWSGSIIEAKIIGFGEEGKIVNGTDVTGIPYIAKYGLDDPSRNINNYLRDGREYRKIQ